jgi:hypothetical protein
MIKYRNYLLLSFLFFILEKFDNLDLDFYYRIAWGYLRPNGFA